MCLPQIFEIALFDPGAGEKGVLAAKEEIGNQPKRWVDNQKERLLGALGGQNFDADIVFFPAWTRVEVPLFTTH
ncbi:hypothetical protein FF2_039494 [Malus domestica]